MRRPDADLDEQDVIAYSREHLANFKTPQSVVFYDSLPRNLAGKMVKPQLDLHLQVQVSTGFDWDLLEDLHLVQQMPVVGFVDTPRSCCPATTREVVTRKLTEHVMAQVESTANLDRWEDPACRLMTVILVRCGLRISSARTLAFDCLLHDAQGAPYLRYVNTKMRRYSPTSTE